MGQVICTGYQCQDALINTPGSSEWIKIHDEVPADGGDQTEHFCSLLRTAKPSGCGNSAPSTPMHDPNWQPNGCGPDSFGTAVVNSIISLYPFPAGTGLNNPIIGINFKPACDVHDECYGMGFNKGDCDQQFRNNMNGICGDGSICLSVASIYHDAVVSHGKSAYSRSLSELQCAAWHNDMEQNGCPK